MLRPQFSYNCHLLSFAIARQYSVESQIKFKTSMFRSSLWDYSDAYIPVKESTTSPNTSALDVAVNNRNKKIIFKNCTPFTDCISEMNNAQVENVKDIDVNI